MKCKTINSSARPRAASSMLLAGFLLLAALAFFSRPTAGADAASGHEHGTNVEVFIEWHTNHVLLHYGVAANKSYTLQYLPLASTNNRGTNLLNSPWLNFPAVQQAPRLPAAYPWEIKDFSVTNRNPTNLGRVYRLKVT